MKKSVKKIVASLMSFALLVAMLPVSSFAAPSGATSVDWTTATQSDGWLASKVTETNSIATSVSGATNLSNVLSITVNTASAGREYRRALPVTGADAGFTIEFDVLCRDGGAAVFGGYGSTTTVDVSPSAFTYKHNNEIVTKSDASFDSGEWHHFAISYDPNNGGNFLTYYDGECLTTDALGSVGVSHGNVTTVRFGAALDATGTVIFANADQYTGLYDPTASPYVRPTLTVNSADDSVILSDGTICCKGTNADTVAEMKSTLVVDGGTNISVYTNSSMTELCADSASLKGTEYIALESASKTYNYYPVDFERVREYATPIPVTLGEGGSYGASGQPSTAVQLANLGGKGDDTAFCYDSTSLTAPAGDKRYGYNIDNTTQFTYEFNIYADGNSVPYFTMNGGYAIAAYNVDGTFSLYNGTELTNLVFERGKWHRVGISYYASRKFVVYVDDQFVGKATAPSDVTQIGFGYRSDSYGGRGAFDDVVKFSGLYADLDADTWGSHNPANHAITTNNTSNLTFNTGTKTIYYKDAADLATLTNEVKTATSAASVAFCDKALASQVTTLDNAKIAVIKSAGDVYHYYKIKKEGAELASLELTGNSAALGATATINNTSSAPFKAVMLLVLKDSNGVIQKVVASPETSVTTSAALTISPADATDLTPEIFFIQSWANRHRLFDDIYTQTDLPYIGD